MKSQLVSLVCRYCESMLGEKIAYCPRCRNGKAIRRIRRSGKRIRERAS